MTELIDTKFEAEILPNDVLCDKCTGEILVGETVYIEKSTGNVYCENCVKEKKPT